MLLIIPSKIAILEQSFHHLIVKLDFYQWYMHLIAAYYGCVNNEKSFNDTVSY